MYEFIKIKDPFSNGIVWYFVAKTYNDVIIHFNKFVRMSFKDGIRDRINSTHIYENGRKYIEHPSTQWNAAVELQANISGNSWMESADYLEKRTYKERLQAIDKYGEIYLTNGLSYAPKNAFTDSLIVDKIEKETFEYPIEAQYHMEEVRFLQWNSYDMKGTHWYAKIGNEDIVDEKGNQKWNTKEEAIKAAQQYIDKQLHIGI